MSSLAIAGNVNPAELSHVLKCMTCDKRKDCLYYVNNKDRFKEFLLDPTTESIIRVDREEHNVYRVWYADHQYTDVFMN